MHAGMQASVLHTSVRRRCITSCTSHNHSHSCTSPPPPPPLPPPPAGKYKGVPVSIVSTMMGMPNMDFVVRENRAVVDGEMAIIRLGTCGAVRPPAKLGCLLLASKGSICVRRDVDAFTRMYETIEASHRHSHGHHQGHEKDHLHAGSEHAATLRQHLNGNGKQHSNGHANGTSAHHSNGKQHSNGSSNGSHSNGKQVDHFGLPQVPYLMSLPVPADQELAQLLSKAAAEQVRHSGLCDWCSCLLLAARD